MRPPLLALPPHALLYVMIKPPLAPRDACVACRKALGINPHYAANRFHCTMLPLGRWDAWPDARLATLIAALGGFAFDPFFAVFDRVAYGAKKHATLRPRRGLRAPARFHAALRDHLAAVGIAPAARPAATEKADAGKKAHFQMHLTLAYRGPHPGGGTGTVAIDPIGWWVDEFQLVCSIHGSSQHEVLGRWPLIAQQEWLPLGDPLFRPHCPGPESAGTVRAAEQAMSRAAPTVQTGLAWDIPAERAA